MKKSATGLFGDCTAVLEGCLTSHIAVSSVHFYDSCFSVWKSDLESRRFGANPTKSRITAASARLLCLFFIKKGTIDCAKLLVVGLTFANRHNNIMKICAACSQELPREKFSKKQWQLKQQRRCKECITDNREVQLEAPANDDDSPPAPLMSSADGEGVLPSWSDEELFKPTPPTDECPICLLPLPLDGKEVIYQECCGKILCGGCFYEESTENNIRDICPFCRAPEHSSDGEYIERFKKRVEANDAEAIYRLGCFYNRGSFGLPKTTKRQGTLASSRRSRECDGVL